MALNQNKNIFQFVKAIKKAAVFMAMLAGIIACDVDVPLVEEYKVMDRAGWFYDSAAVFELPVEDTTQQYNLYILLRNTSGYQYYNIYIRPELYSPIGELLYSNLKEVDLMHSRSGAPYGEVSEPRGKAAGNVFTHEVPLLQNHRFSRSGNYRLQLRHYMRLDTLPEVEAIGVRLEFAQPVTSRK
jgi:gliding motility-associated lipoprotein GldH